MNRSRYQFSPASLAWVILLTLSIGTGLGLLLGKSLWQPVVVTRPVERAQRPARQPHPVSQETIQAEPAYRLLAQEAELLAAAGEFAAAIDRLIEADLVAANPGAADWVGRRLEQTTQAYVAVLSADGRDDLIDDLYQRLTLTMPEKAIFFLKLAVHRIESGLSESALPVLAQIENHQQYGLQARELMAGIAAEPALAGVFSLPLEKKGDQYLVQAQIDGQIEVTLLIDTGASMTILTPEVLSALGYRLDGDQANFSTANGLVTGPLVQLDRIALGEVVVAPITVGALTLGGPKRGFDGLLGMNFLRRFEFSLDQSSQRLHLKEATSP